METHIETTSTLKARPALIFQLAELLIVFLAPALILATMASWIGENPLRSQGVVAVGNVTMLLLIWGGLKLRGESWSDIGLTFRSVSLQGALKIFGLSLIVCAIASVAFIMAGLLPIGSTGIPASPDFSQYDYLRNNIGWLLLSLASVYLVSSFGEEVVYRGFLINRISQLGGGTKLATLLAVVLSSIIFGLIHYTWGPMGMIQTGFMGLAMALCYVTLKKRLWILIIAHAYMDTFLLVQLYMASN